MLAKEAEMSERKAHVIVEVDVTDAAKYADYTKLSIPAVAAFGGHYLAAGEPEVLEGDKPAPRVVMVEFDSRDAATAFYRSERYQDARKFRANAARVSMYVVPPQIADEAPFYYQMSIPHAPVRQDQEGEST
jgi:uncharacterized protein (DUF1330 family)